MCMIMTQAPTPGTTSLVASRCRKAVGIAENALDFGIGLVFDKIVDTASTVSYGFVFY